VGRALCSSLTERLDRKARDDLARLQERMAEWNQLDYIPDKDLEDFDQDTLKLAGELLQADAGKVDRFNEYDITAPGQTAQDVESAVLDDHEVRFSDFIERKRNLWNSTSHAEETGLLIDQIAPEVDHTAGMFGGHAEDEDQETTETRPLPKNIIRIEDPDDLLGRRSAGSLKPAIIKDEFLAPTMLRDDNPGKFLGRPALSQLSSVRNLNAWLNRYILMRDREVWSERQILDDFCEEALKFVTEKYSFSRLPSSLRVVFFVENPLFVYCVFARRKDKENAKKHLKVGEKDVKPSRRRYSWAGHLYAHGRDGTNDPVELPPSTFRLLPASLHSNGNATAAISSRRGGGDDGWE
jgi:hypothetical protein